jgi:FkbM family methyltransferase
MSYIWRSLAVAIARPYISRELPGWGKLYSLAVGSYERDWLWRDSGPIIAKSKVTGYSTLNISRWPDRAFYFLNRWYALDVQLLAAKFIKPGDDVIDVGANRGMFSLVASHLVGPTGRVLSFEPNPQVIEIFKSDMAINNISNVTLYEFGLSDRQESLTLTIPRVNSGGASFGQSEDTEVDKMVLPVKIGDEILCAVKPSFIKMDIEGFEMHALRGLKQTIELHKPVILMEVGNALESAGSSVSELFEFMRNLDYAVKRLGVKGVGRSWDCSLSDITEQEIIGDITFDAVWLPA